MFHPRFRALSVNWLGPVLFVVAVFLPLRAAIADWYDVPTGSMRPTIVEGDRIFVVNAAFGLRVPLTHTWIARWGKPARGDIVTLASPVDGTRLVKRVIGLPGDVVSLHRNKLSVNGQPVVLEETSLLSTERIAGGDRTIPGRIRHEWLTGRPHPITDTALADRDLPPLRVPDGHVFVMGDNRDLSLDSRSFGPVAIERVRGRASHVVISLDPDRWYRPRFTRWFRSFG